MVLQRYLSLKMTVIPSASLIDRGSEYYLRASVDLHILRKYSCEYNRYDSLIFIRFIDVVCRTQGFVLASYFMHHVCQVGLKTLFVITYYIFTACLIAHILWSAKLSPLKTSVPCIAQFDTPAARSHH